RSDEPSTFRTENQGPRPPLRRAGIRAYELHVVRTGMSSTLADDARDRAFERLYTRHVRDVYRYVLAVVRNPAEAEDVTQTTFLNAYRAMQAGAEPRLAQNWLIAIAHNACRSRRRLTMRRPR